MLSLHTTLAFAAAFQNFDGITYGKGASVLKNLHKIIGADAFREGMRTYFKKHAWGNTTLADFLAALQTATDVNMSVRKPLLAGAML